MPKSFCSWNCPAKLWPENRGWGHLPYGLRPASIWDGWKAGKRKSHPLFPAHALAMPIPCPFIAISFLPLGLIMLSTERCEYYGLNKNGGPSIGTVSCNTVRVAHLCSCRSGELSLHELENAQCPPPPKGLQPMWRITSVGGTLLKIQVPALPQFCPHPW